MSHIPNKVMPHAGTIVDDPAETESGRSGFFRKNAARAADRVREHPRTAAAAGVAVVAGLAAAATLPFLRKPAATTKKRTTRKSA